MLGKWQRTVRNHHVSSKCVELYEYKSVFDEAHGFLLKHVLGVVCLFSSENVGALPAVGDP